MELIITLYYIMDGGLCVGYVVDWAPLGGGFCFSVFSLRYPSVLPLMKVLKCYINIYINEYGFRFVRGAKISTVNS